MSISGLSTTRARHTVRHTNAMAQLDDSELITLTRSGDSRAYAELWVRHSKRAHSVAQRITSSSDPADLVAEAFTRILSAIRGGAGPTESFSGYLHGTIRNLAANWARNSLQKVTLDEEAEVASEQDLAASAEFCLTAAAAFRSLPERWQSALWYTEIEGLSTTELASALGTTPSAAAMVLSRARARLKSVWAD